MRYFNKIIPTLNEKEIIHIIIRITNFPRHPNERETFTSHILPSVEIHFIFIYRLVVTRTHSS